MRPFLKWAGGKRTLLPIILDAAPSSCVNYYEPFFGGGAVFFALKSEKRVQRMAYLNDVNEELIETYRAVRDDTSRVIGRLKIHAKLHDEQYFYKQREKNIANEKSAIIAARMIYLNRTCFNGLYRVNKSGVFNVPFGSYKNPTICDVDNLESCASLLKKTKLTSFDFEKVAEKAQAGDFVYFDPPYLPRVGNEFTSYASGGFSMDDHIRLRDVALALKKRGVSVMLSNSGAQEVYDLYKRGFKIREVKGVRNVGAAGHTRGVMPDVLIT
jgi:DNA adenine methylase